MISQNVTHWSQVTVMQKDIEGSKTMMLFYMSMAYNTHGL